MKKKLKNIAMAVLLLLTGLPAVRAQIVIDVDNSGRTEAHRSAALEIISSDKGVLIPRMSYLQRQYIPVDSAAEGLLVYQTDRVSGFYLYDGKAWKCLNPIEMPDLGEDETPSFAEVAFTGSYNDLKDKPVIPEAIEGLAEVAYSGSYKDLKDRPNIPVITDSAGNEQQLDFSKVALTGDYNDLKNLPVIPDELTGLADVAFSGSYKDLKNLPKIPTKLSELESNEYYRTVNEAEKKRWNAAAARSVPTMLRELQDDYDHQTVTEADKARWNAAAEKPVPTALSDLEQNEYYQTVSDADKARWDEAAARKLPTKLSDLEQDYNNLLVTEKEKDTWNDAAGRTGWGGTWDDIIGKPELAKVATSGDYNDLKNLPKIPTKLSELKQDEYNRTISDEERAKWNAKSDFSGRYTDLTDRPTIPTMLRDLEQDYNHMLVTEKDIERWNEVSMAASFSGSYNDLTDRPTIPTKLSELEQNEYYQTVSKSDKDKWNAAANITVPTSLAELKEDIFHMLVTSQQINKWNASAERVVPTRLSELVSDENHQVVTSDEKRTWNEAANKVESFPAKGEVNRWQSAANTVILNGNNWTDMYNTSVELREMLNRLENGDEGERLHPVAKSGNYEDLKNKPYVPSATEINNWNAKVANLKAVATSGSYNDLTGKPSFAKVAFSGSYKDLVDTPRLQTVAYTGSYADLTNKPTLSATSNGDVTGSMESGLTLKSDRTLNGTVTMTGSLRVNGGQTAGTGQPNVSIEVSNNIRINNPLTINEAKGGGYDNYAATVGLSRALDAEALTTAKQYMKDMIPEGTVAMWDSDAAIPDCWEALTEMAGRFPVGVGKSSDGETSYKLGETGGEEEHQLTEKEMPSHSHTIEYEHVGRAFTGNKPALNVDGSGNTFTSSYSGGDQPHENRPPYYAIKFIVRRNRACKNQ